MSKYAYVTVMYGNNIYLTGALVLGYTLYKTKTEYDRIILVTPDVSDLYKSYLSDMYTKIIDIDYVQVNSNIFLEQETRFRDVFTKLACLNLVQYQKIILLDLDMIVAKNIDHLFKLNPPAACLKKYHISYGKKIPSKMICDGNKLVGSINAGLMLLHPDKKEWISIQNDIMNNNQINKYKYPEQDYLSLRYCDKWTSITFNYNFQFGLTNRVKKYSYGINNIYVIHYSSSYKPWNILIPDRMISNEEKKFINQHKKYYDLWINIYKKIKTKYQDKNIILPY
ncbi:putative glycosyltransferase [Saudi moumouvirus]|nr:putative glycosyltransferase [Saudi moumouvirus]